MLNIDVKLRYLPILKILGKKKQEETILEVGGGAMNVSKFLDAKITVCDPCFRDGVTDGNVTAVCGDARSMPFEDNSFDYVVSSDMLEHIEPKDRKKVIDEMLRVAKKYVVIGFPCGEKTRKYEERVFKIGKFFGKEHKWIKEHLDYDYLTEEEVKSYFGGRKVKVIPNSNLNLWFVNELMNPYLWFVSWGFYPVFLFFSNKGDCHRKVFVVCKEGENE